MGGDAKAVYELIERICAAAKKGDSSARAARAAHLSLHELSQWLPTMGYILDGGVGDGSSSTLLRHLLARLVGRIAECMAEMDGTCAIGVFCGDNGAPIEKAHVQAQRAASSEEVNTEEEIIARAAARRAATCLAAALEELVLPETSIARQNEILEMPLAGCAPLRASKAWSIMLRTARFTPALLSAVRWEASHSLALAPHQTVYFDVCGEVYMGRARAAAHAAAGGAGSGGVGYSVTRFERVHALDNRIGETDMKTPHWIARLLQPLQSVLKSVEVAVHSVDTDLIFILLLNTPRFDAVAAAPAACGAEGGDAMPHLPPVLTWFAKPDLAFDVYALKNALLRGDAHATLAGEDAPRGPGTEGWQAVWLLYIAYLLAGTDYTAGMPGAMVTTLLKGYRAGLSGRSPPCLVTFMPSKALMHVDVHLARVRSLFWESQSEKLREKASAPAKRYDIEFELQRVQWAALYALNGAVSPLSPELRGAEGCPPRPPFVTGVVGHGWDIDALRKFVFQEYRAPVLHAQVPLKRASEGAPVERRDAAASRKRARGARTLDRAATTSDAGGASRVRGADAEWVAFEGGEDAVE